jgi:ketosteroid isomerase-like protein
MKKSILTTAFLFMLLAMPLLNVQSQSNEELKAKIEKLNSQMCKAMLAGDHEKNLSLYTNDAISLPSYSPMLTGIAEIKKSNEEMAKSGAKILSFEITTKNITPAGNLIIEIGLYKMSMKMEGMEELINDNGKYITVWEKQADGSLKIKIETWNTDVNPMANMHKEM